MSEKIFKGFKQVKFESFSALKNEEKAGYLWFVRTEVPEVEGANDVANDEYDIYFGSRHYGHFCEGELSAIEAKITALEGKHDNEVTEILDTLSKATETIASQADAINTNIANIAKINEDLALKANESSLASYISKVEYTDDKKIVFKNADDTQLAEVDATPFIKDGILEDVDVVVIEEVPEENPHGLVAGEKYIKFVWNTDGESKEDYILASEIGATYTGSDSITISTDNIISVKEVGGDKVNVTEIPVGGTPLADILLAKNIDTINSGNLQEVLESLFSQNNWAVNPTRTLPTSLTVSMNTPSISLDKTGTQEVGTTVNLSASAKTASASAKITYSGFDYGYSMTDDDIRDAEGNPAEVSITGNIKDGSAYKLTFDTNNGFGGVDVADVTGSTTSGNTLVVAEGTNKVTVTAYSPEFTATVPAQDKIYACSSLKKTDESHIVSASTATTIDGAVKTVTASTSVTGAYYAFIGYSDTLPTTNAEYRAFIGNNLTRLGKGGNISGTCNKTYFAVCIPSDWDFTCNTSLGSDMRNSFTETGDVTITLPNNETKAYKYYALTYKDGAFKDLVIK